MTIFSISDKRRHSIALETRDSLIIAKMSEMKYKTTMASFDLSPRDSVELKHESILGLRKKSSKIASAKDSVELVKESLIKLKLLPDCRNKQQAKRDSISRPAVPGPKPATASLICCDKCARHKQSIEVLDGILGRKTDEEPSADRLKKSSEVTKTPIRISHIEVIQVPEQSKSQVAFEEPVVDIELDVANIYKPEPVPSTKGESFIKLQTISKKIINICQITVTKHSQIKLEPTTSKNT